jgi:hypothetical protein
MRFPLRFLLLDGSSIGVSEETITWERSSSGQTGAIVTEKQSKIETNGDDILTARWKRNVIK